MPAKKLSTRLLHWHQHHGRHELPWQKQITPYRVWVSEVMLQQTTVPTVSNYFPRFIRRFPSLKQLARAPLDDVLQLWTGLGYYNRARNMHRTAQIVHHDHHGRFPRTVEALCLLPGIGRSTAGAILSLGMQQRAPILDGNVKRVFARHLGLTDPTNIPPTVRQLWDYAETQLPTYNYRDYNQSLMDLGALVCTAKQPDCPQCPLKTTCQARLTNQTDRIPP